ncbi:unnamed protein product [Enterobius vermicularis]|uniref:PhoLip_ATPase_C domain-containing protein n=1 Tax=Enterobius vermicularis TaxID=51028 RepID=A0A0N4VIY8_ENTVE|nr:unnamed protein product [Enterobius vermicularis]
MSQVVEFWRLLALCHTVMPERKDGRLEYQAQSPDEAALTSAARNFGYVFKSRTPNTITIEVNGVEEKYDLLCILDFNNVRKRMSVIVKNKQGEITLYCKGADTIIKERHETNTSGEIAKISRLSLKTCELLWDATAAHLDRFAGDGLRTLCVAYKEIDSDYFALWQMKYKEAAVAIENRQKKLDAVYEEIEQNMILLGATAIEDKLQDGVPETIAKLTEANIKIWVLTGDKQETAINIGYSCRLLTETLREVFVIDGEKEEEVEVQLKGVRRRLDQTLGQDPEGSEGFALIINGHSLDYALNERLERTFLDVGCMCQASFDLVGKIKVRLINPTQDFDQTSLIIHYIKAVVCCRVTPLQKARVVDLVKRHKKAVTLAVGDGANDVSMIKTAHIGIGISGQEGMQAVLASDFSIGQFRYLERLLLVHGKWSYFRMTKFLTYFFYKNFSFTLTHFWYSFFCGYSAQVHQTNADQFHP